MMTSEQLSRLLAGTMRRPRRIALRHTYIDELRAHFQHIDTVSDKQHFGRCGAKERA